MANFANSEREIYNVVVEFCDQQEQLFQWQMEFGGTCLPYIRLPFTLEMPLPSYAKSGYQQFALVRMPDFLSAIS